MKALKLARNIFVIFFIVTALVITVFTIISISFFDNTQRSIFGYKALIILSDSMKKTDFDAGDLALIKQVDPGTLKEGDIIAYISQNSSNFGKTVTHKIRRLTTDANGSPGFITYGTTSDIDDEIIVTYPYIIGKYEAHIPNLGCFFQFLKTVPGYLLCVFLPFMLFIVSECIHCIMLLQKYRKEQRSALQAERDQIEAERARNQEMMRQLLAMKSCIEDTPSQMDPFEST